MDRLEKKFNIIIFDIISIVHPHFIKAYFKEKKIRKYIHKVKDFKEFKNLFSKITSKKENMIIFNFNKSINLYSFLINLIIKKSKIATCEFNNPGNYFWTKKELNLVDNFFFQLKNLFYFNKLFFMIKEKTFSLLNKIFNIQFDFLCVAGRKYRNAFLKNDKRIINISSWDYSRVLNKEFKIKKYKKKIITFLDAPGPKFKSDSFLFKKKNDETSKETYPALIKFFNLLEKTFKLDVVIAAHPKTKHIKFPSYFGKRKVYSNKTQELVYNSKFVITRNSSAITYAIQKNIPIIFFYTNEILKIKGINLFSIKGLAKELGYKAININDNIDKKLLLGLIKIKKRYYRKFQLDYFCNLKKKIPNFKIFYEIF